MTVKTFMYHGHTTSSICPSQSWIEEFATAFAASENKRLLTAAGRALHELESRNAAWGVCAELRGAGVIPVPNEKNSQSVDY